ncbi:MAG: hypothetical protein QXZ44_01255 [Ferroplasma sp.]
MVDLMAIYKKKTKDEFDLDASYEELEKDIWKDDEKNSGRKPGSIPRK